MYDYAHPVSDSLERITHSICTLEFEDHRPLYDWFLDTLGIYHSQQIEFARLNLTYTVMSKRKLRMLVEEGIVSGWDDPRMPTISGLRRRGYTPEAIRDFCERIGVAKSNSMVDIAMLEYCIRDDLNLRVPRVMAVLRPLKLIIDNYPEGQVEELEAEYNPENPALGSRKLPFSRELYIEQEDFCENPPKKYFRLSPGQEVRLKNAYIIRCQGVVKDEKTGEVLEVHCSYDPKPAAAAQPVPARSREPCTGFRQVTPSRRKCVYTNTFLKENPDEEKDFKSCLNPNSLTRLTSCLLERSLAGAEPGSRFQFMRNGYFCVDTVDSTKTRLVFNRIVPLKDTWAKIQKANK